MTVVSVASARSEMSQRANEDARARPGDVAAFLGLVREHEVGLRRLAFRLLEDRERAADALQEAYLRAFRALPRYRGEAALRTWVYRITYNVCIDELRRGGPLTVPLSDAAGCAAVAEPAAATEPHQELADALRTLSPVERATVLLVDAEGLSYAEAADVLGVPVGTVASRLSHARGVLRRVLADPKGASSR